MATTKAIPSHSGPPPGGKPAAAAAAGGGPSPSATLYITNLPEKLRKPDLRASLYTLFSTYGVVLDVNAMRGNKMRGQAHIVMRDVSSSTQAMRALQDFDFFGKELRIRYSDNSKGRSHVFNRLEGEWKETGGDGKNGADDGKKQSAFEAPRPAVQQQQQQQQQQNGEKDAAGPGLQGGRPAVGDAKSPEVHGVKRQREDEDEEDEQEASMDEDDDDDDVEMEESDED